MEQTIKWVMGIASGLIMKFAIEDPIDNILLSGFRANFAHIPQVGTSIDILELGLAVGTAIWVYNFISRFFSDHSGGL
jgi:hypothetical protein